MSATEQWEEEENTGLSWIRTELFRFSFAIYTFLIKVTVKEIDFNIYLPYYTENIYMTLLMYRVQINIETH